MLNGRSEYRSPSLCFLMNHLSSIVFAIILAQVLNRFELIFVDVWINIKVAICRGGSPGLVVMGDDLFPRGCGYESRHRTLDGHFSHLFCVKIVLFVWKDWKTRKRGRGQPIFFKKNGNLWVARLPMKPKRDWLSGQEACVKSKRLRSILANWVLVKNFFYLMCKKSLKLLKVKFFVATFICVASQRIWVVGYIF